MLAGAGHVGGHVCRYWVWVFSMQWLWPVGTEMPARRRKLEVGQVVLTGGHVHPLRGDGGSWAVGDVFEITTTKGASVL